MVHIIPSLERRERLQKYRRLLNNLKKSADAYLGLSEEMMHYTMNLECILVFLWSHSQITVL